MSDTSGDEGGAIIAAATVQTVPAPPPTAAVTSAAKPAVTQGPGGIPIGRQTSQKPQCMNGPLYKQSEHRVVTAQRFKRRKAGPWKQLACWLVENQIGT